MIHLYTVWLDRKAFDSVLHKWLPYALKLAKVPEKLIVAVAELPKVWKTKLQLNGTHERIMTKIIILLKGIFQGDSLSIIFFILSVNPLSHLLNHLKGYAAGNERNINITHSFFVDDLKLYVGTTKKLLDIVNTFSKDIDTKFEVDKCFCIKISTGKQTNSKIPQW